ncbi:hypothetical protein C8R44DRAFT_862991 [Mycena epipterygia]|nr:hypothetical protein C8R44DRAFT_862991 [Mycena epipterygia]
MPATHPVATQLPERLHFSGSTNTLLGPADHALFVKQVRACVWFCGSLNDGRQVTGQFFRTIPPSSGRRLQIYLAFNHTIFNDAADDPRFGRRMPSVSPILIFVVAVHNEDGMEESIAILIFLMVYSDHYHRNIESLSKNTKAKLITVLRAVQDFYDTRLLRLDLLAR